MVVAEAAIAEDGQKEENMHKPKWHTPIKFNQSKFNFLPNTFPIWLLSPIDGAMIPRHARDGTAFVCVHDFSPTTSMAVHVRRERCTLRCVIYRVDSIKSKKCILTIDESNTKVLRSRQTKKKHTHSTRPRIRLKQRRPDYYHGYEAKCFSRDSMSFAFGLSHNDCWGVAKCDWSDSMVSKRMNGKSDYAPSIRSIQIWIWFSRTIRCTTMLSPPVCFRLEKEEKNLEWNREILNLRNSIAILGFTLDNFVGG